MAKQSAICYGSTRHCTKAVPGLVPYSVPQYRISHVARYRSRGVITWDEETRATWTRRPHNSRRSTHRWHEHA
eukprot:1948492-Rhodomonas_salina.1